MPNVAIIGSTGSIGTQTLQVIEDLPDFQVSGLAVHRNIDRLLEQIEYWNPQLVAVGDPARVGELKKRVSMPVLAGADGLCELAVHPSIDIVVVSVVGAAGLAPTLAALKAGKKVALANKETLVAGGSLVMQYRDQVIPIDSEHSALWQCLDGKERSQVDSLILSASGGPFRNYPREFAHITVAEALNHPTWKMGGKITIDSATLMNKGLEVIEAHWLFGFPYSKIEVVIHPQSVIHSLIRMIDGSLLAQMATTDMRLPIQYALTYPQVRKSGVEPLDLTTLSALTFEEPDWDRFPCLALAYEAGRRGGLVPAIMNAGNEVAVNAFLEGRLRFIDIPELVAETMEIAGAGDSLSLPQILAADQEARRVAEGLLSRYKKRMVNR